MFPVDTVKTMMQARPQHCTLPLAAHRGGQTAVLAAAPLTPIDVAARLWRNHGGMRLWRGVQTMFIGCIPAHGAYFTICALTPGPALDRRAREPPSLPPLPPADEGAKPHLARLALPFLSARRGGGAGGGAAGGGASATAESAQALAAGGAVALGTIAHDLIMTPMDVCKQRMQLSAGGSPGVYACACTILQQAHPLGDG